MKMPIIEGVFKEYVIFVQSLVMTSKLVVASGRILRIPAEGVEPTEPKISDACLCDIDFGVRNPIWKSPFKIF